MYVVAAGGSLEATIPDRLVEALVPAPSVPVTIVEKPRLSLGENGIGLGEFPEASLRVRIRRNVWVELASKGMESPLDGVVIGVP
jgi:hypothetical protein